MLLALENTVPKNTEDKERLDLEITTLRNKKRFLISNPGVLVKPKKRANKKRRKGREVAVSEPRDEAGPQRWQEEGPLAPPELLSMTPALARALTHIPAMEPWCPDPQEHGRNPSSLCSSTGDSHLPHLPHLPHLLLLQRPTELVHPTWEPRVLSDVAEGRFHEFVHPLEEELCDEDERKNESSVQHKQQAQPATKALLTDKPPPGAAPDT